MRVIGHNDNLVCAISRFAHFTHQTEQNKHLATPFRMDGSIHTTSTLLERKKFTNVLDSSHGLFFLVSIFRIFHLLNASSTIPSFASSGFFFHDQTRVVAKFHQHLNISKTVGLLTTHDMLHILRVDKVLVYIFLHGCQVTTNNLNKFGRQMLSIQCINST